MSFPGSRHILPKKLFRMITMEYDFFNTAKVNMAWSLLSIYVVEK